mmetsp:Transcript_28922/g.73132  ORF Transcript_28922/g.73132 Transcript_28922/m.73132 type:complete len:95 (-) Transcript_28922:557-841(-)
MKGYSILLRPQELLQKNSSSGSVSHNFHNSPPPERSVEPLRLFCQQPLHIGAGGVFVAGSPSLEAVHPLSVERGLRPEQLKLVHKILVNQFQRV